MQIDSVNASKSSYIIFHSTITSILSYLSIRMGKKSITGARYVKFVGILLDKHLSWKYHLSELSKTLARTC